LCIMHHKSITACRRHAAMISSYCQGASKGFLGIDLGSSEVREAQS
jgi:hypothetical protein